MQTNHARLQTLQAMGIRELFTPAADLTGFSASRSLFVREAVHKATVEVTEEGTVAAAATGQIQQFHLFDKWI